MARSVMLSNGHMLVGLDETGLVHDFYYPYVGLDNLTTSRSVHHNIGAWVNGNFSWLQDPSWKISIDFDEDSLVSNIKAVNADQGVELLFRDFVDYEYTAFCRHIIVNNTTDKDIEVRLFLHQVFQISRAGRSDTALYIPTENYILDYKGWCSLLIYAQKDDGQGFDEYAVGNYGIEGKEGTFRDAEDGILSNNPVEHGGVDSVVKCSVELSAKSSSSVSYWIVAADSQLDAEAIHHTLKQQGLQRRMEKTQDHWEEWLSIGEEKLSKIDPDYRKFAKKSLLVVKSHIDNNGGLIASCDSTIYNYGRDYYSYVWPRDSALSILPLILLGYTVEPRKFFDFCVDTAHPSGYLMHKYQPDRSIGSTWHPLLHKNHPELAIQEDETAEVLYILGIYLKTSNDIDYVSSIYERFIKPAADFISTFIDEPTGLPHASYDLWEQKFGTHTYTVATVIGSLKMASYIATRLRFHDDSQKWQNVANNIQEKLESLYNSEKHFYRKSILLQEDGGVINDDILDISSAYGMATFNSQQSNQNQINDTFKAIETKLFNSSPSGGVPRYEHDDYFLSKTEYYGNPWIIGTLWLAQHYIKNNQADKAKEIISWVQNKATPSGMLSEQVDPETGEGLGVCPLVWSHASFLETALLLSGITYEA